MASNNVVDIWFETYDNPMSPVAQEIRRTILVFNSRIG